MWQVICLCLPTMTADCYQYLFQGSASPSKWVQAGRLGGFRLSAQPDLQSFWPSF
jgi:hypothetical protein